MGKVKIKHFICFLMFAVFTIAVQPLLFGQDYLSREGENEIKMSGKYYWGEGSDFVEEMAKLNASVELSNHIIKDAVIQSEQLDEILKAIETGVHLERLQQQGKIKILAWIAKDSVMLTVSVTTLRPITQITEPQAIVSEPIKKEAPVPKQEPTIPAPVRDIVETNNSVLQELAACRTFNDVRRVANTKGLVRGTIGGGSKGFQNPEDCIIAVFTSDGQLAALLDTGSQARIDLLSGKTVQNPEQYYNEGDYLLWYMMQKKQ